MRPKLVKSVFLEIHSMTTISPPPFRIYLLRHANASPQVPGTRDFDRSLSDEGFGEAEIVAENAADKGYHPEIILCSTARRCRETAEAVRRSLDAEVECRFIDELYNAPTDVYLNLIASQASATSVMLIGHNPTISQTLASLIGLVPMTSALQGGFPTAGYAVIDADRDADPTGPRWRLTDFLKP
jgi:phosphohistidine phosphatase